MVFLRGGADGLSLVAPWMMPSYRTLRPTIRIKDDTEFADPTGVAGLPLVQGGNVAPFALSGTLRDAPGHGEPLQRRVGGGEPRHGPRRGHAEGGVRHPLPLRGGDELGVRIRRATP